MASSSSSASYSVTLYSNLTFVRPSAAGSIRCGPRSNRGPLMKGRILSIEAIQAIQTLKRAHRSDPENLPSNTISRLIKGDLLATLNELLRQDQCALALHVFSAVRSEYKPDLSTYAAVVLALGRNKMGEDIDRLICDLERVDIADSRGLTTLLRALIHAGRTESTARIYELMKRSGWGPTSKAHGYIVKVLNKGFKRLGEESLAYQVRKGIVANSEVNLETSQP